MNQNAPGFGPQPPFNSGQNWNGQPAGPNNPAGQPQQPTFHPGYSAPGYPPQQQQPGPGPQFGPPSQPTFAVNNQPNFPPPGASPQQPMPSQGNAQQPKPRKKRPMIVGVIALILLLLIGGWAWYFMGPVKGPGSMEKQWNAMKGETPDGQVVVMEWRQGPAHAERGVNKVDWLSLYWVDGKGSAQYLTRHPYEKDQSGPAGHVKLAGYQNQAVSSKDLKEFQDFSETIKCGNDQFRFARMFKLPDGTPMFQGGCSKGYNNAINRADTIVLEGQSYEPKKYADLVALAAKLGPHYGFEFAKLSLLTGQYVGIESCISDPVKNSYLNACRSQAVVNVTTPWPYVTIREQNPDGLKWPPGIGSQVPAGLGAAPIKPNAVDQAKVEGAFKKLSQNGVAPGNPRFQMFLTSHRDSFAVVVIDLERKVMTFFDAEGNPLPTR